MVTYPIDTRHESRWTRIGHFLAHEFREVLPPTIFFFIGFNLILFTKRLILEDYLIQFTGFFIATTAALIVGKTVLVAEMMPIIRRFDYAPLALPILFKSVVYTSLVFVARLIEAFIHYLLNGGIVGKGGFIEEQLGSFSWHRFIATQMWIFVLFLIYTTASQLNDLFGDGELFKIFFNRRSSRLKMARRARVRLLVELARLTEAHSIDVLSDRTTAPHAELVRILQRLARDDRSLGSDAGEAALVR